MKLHNAQLIEAVGPQAKEHRLLWGEEFYNSNLGVFRWNGSRSALWSKLRDLNRNIPNEI